MMTRFRSAVLLFLIFSAALVQAADKPPQKLPPGLGRYILVLKVVGERRDTPKTITEPDVAKLGGKVLSKHDNRRVIELPLAAAKNLRKDENVAYLQRVWMGESFDTWDERDTTSGSSALKAHTDDVAGNDLTWSTGNFGYDPSGNIKAMGSDAYTYDTASRLVKSVVNGTTETYGYDSFGNLTQKATGGLPSVIPAIDSTSNRISGEVYDAEGNITTVGGRTAYLFDSIGSMAELDTPFGQRRRMIYTADDERIGEMLDSQLVRWKIRDFNTGQILREFQSEEATSGDVWEWTEDYVYAGGAIVGAEMDDYFGGKRHFHTDHLGSVRMITNDSRLRYSRNDYYPFGLEQSSSVQEATNFGFWRSDPVKFTGHERDYYGFLNVDNSDYLDYMHARFYNPSVGRFLSVDPVSGTMTSPQSWNRYTYASNAPIIYIDRYGREFTCSWDGDVQRCTDTIDVATTVEPLVFDPDTPWRIDNIIHNLPDPPRQFSLVQCEEARALLAKERQIGTQATATQSSNTWSDKTAMVGFNNDIGGHPNFRMMNGQIIDIDWFTDLSAFGGEMDADDELHGIDAGTHANLFVPPAYLIGKSVWYLSHGGAKGYNAPLQDPGERTALRMAFAGARYSEIFTNEFMARECP